MNGMTILDGIRVASPCPAGWDQMIGDDRRRHCEACGKDVYDISAMTTEQALKLVAAPKGDGPPCVRFYRRADGTVMTADCPVGLGRARRHRLRQVAGLGIVGVAYLATAASALGLRREAIARPPSGPGANLDDWIDWALVTVGLRQPSRGVTLGMISPVVFPTPTPPVVVETGREMISADEY